MVFPGALGDMGHLGRGHGFLETPPGERDPWWQQSGSTEWPPRGEGHRVGVPVPLTSAGLAHEGHDLARGQREGEVFEHLEARAAGVTGRSQDTLSETGFPAPCRPGPSQSLTVPLRGLRDVSPQVPSRAPLLSSAWREGACTHPLTLT